MKAIDHCPNCGSASKAFLYRVADRHYGIKGEFTLSICKDCRLVFLDPMPSEKDLISFYPEESYYSYSIDFGKKEPVWKRMLRDILFLKWKTKDPTFPSPGIMLDIGCGNGWFIFDMRAEGWNVFGVEPSKAGAETGRKMANLNIHHGDLISAGYASNYFDYVRSNHSFEHIPNPNEVLTDIYRIMKPGGKGFIGVPNYNSLNARLFGPFWYYLGAPVHTFNYSGDNLTSMLTRHGFTNIRVRYNSHYSGLLGSIQIWLNRNSNKTSYEGIVINFVPFRILSGMLMKVSDWLRVGDCIEVTFDKK